MDVTHITLGGRMVPLAIRRHRRARRITLRLSPARDAIVMTLPVRASVASGMAFFHSKSGWVLANVEPDGNVALADGVSIPVLGEDCVIRRMDGRGITEIVSNIPSPLTGEDQGGGEKAGGSEDTDIPPSLILPRMGGRNIVNELRVYSAPEFVARRVQDFLKKRLREACMEQAQAMAETLGKTVREVKIRDTRSRWGSCSRDGTLTFHWQLVFAPPAILRYLVAHETAHLAHMNHSERFWKAVALLCPDYPAARRWLKREGHTLHKYMAAKKKPL